MKPQARAGAGEMGRGGLSSGVCALIVAEAREPHELSDDPFIDASVRVFRAVGLEAAQLDFVARRPDLVFLPVLVDGQSSRQLLDRILASRPRPVVVVVASNDQINAAAEAMRVGAFDCLFRPFSTQRLAKALAAAIEALPAGRRPDQAPLAAHPLARHSSTPVRGHRTGQAPQTDRLIASSPQMRTVLTHLDAVAATDAPVFIWGEEGTGKALAARRLHERSRHADGPLVVVDCATLTAETFAARLTGHQGAMLRATGGTLHLDEIGALSLDLQPRLLSMLDAESHDAEARPRLVASTRYDPRELIRAGQLRPELYYRLRVAPVTLPPLRERRGDIRAVAEGKLEEFAGLEGRGFRAISDEAMAALEAYDWPGNLRELTSAIWSAVVLHDGPQLTREMLPAEIGAPAARAARALTGLDDLVGMTLDEIEREVIEATIRAEGGSIPRAARVLDVSPSTIYRKREAWAKAAKD